MAKYLFKDIVLGEEGLLKGPFGSDLKKDLYVPKAEDTYKVYLQENILEESNECGTYYISKEYYDTKMSRYAVKENDFIVTCDGTLGEIFQLKGITEPGIISSSLLRITVNPNIVDYDYFYYLFKLLIKWQLIRKGNNSVLKHLPGLGDIQKLEVELPDIKEQEKIGKALKNIDEKIRNNNLICSNLTKVTSLLYEYWFVQFDFPDEKGEPYRASGGKMKFDSSLNQNIPEFWEEKTISEIASRVKVGFVGTVDKYYCEREDGGVPIIRPAEMGEDGIDYSSLRFVTKDFHNTNLKSQLHPGDILISRCGKEGIPNIYDENHEAQVLNAVIIEPNDENGGSVFVNEVLKSQYSQIQISNGTSGSVQGVINTEMIGKIKLAYDKDIVKQFEQVLIPLYKEISRLRKENRKLKELVEWIAPMMLSGHVKI